MAPLTRPPTGIGQALREAREARGLTREDVAAELHLPQALVEALEAEAWEAVPPGRGRPLLRRLAEVAGLDLAPLQEAWEALPGGLEEEAPDPARERLERILMGVLGAGVLGLLLWLVIPGRNLKRNATAASAPASGAAQAQPYAGPPPGKYPVLGEVLPEAPVTEEGVLVGLRSLDTCEARIQAPGHEEVRTLKVSDPWRLRVKGPFSLQLANAGVVEVEVAGRRIHTGKGVGEPWSGTFQEDGQLQVPRPPEPSQPPTAPETDPPSPDPERP